MRAPRTRRQRGGGETEKLLHRESTSGTAFGNETPPALHASSGTQKRGSNSAKSIRRVTKERGKRGCRSISSAYQTQRSLATSLDTGRRDFEKEAAAPRSPGRTKRTRSLFSRTRSRVGKQEVEHSRATFPLSKIRKHLDHNVTGKGKATITRKKDDTGHKAKHSGLTSVGSTVRAKENRKWGVRAKRSGWLVRGLGFCQCGGMQASRKNYLLRASAVGIRALGYAVRFSGIPHFINIQAKIESLFVSLCAPSGNCSLAWGCVRKGVGNPARWRAIRG